MLPKLQEPAPLFLCPGCGRGDGAHPPMCQIAVRLTAANAAREGGDWRSRLRAASVYFCELYGCRWCMPARHLRTAADDNPPPDEPGEPLVYSPADNLFHSESKS